MDIDRILQTMRQRVARARERKRWGLTDFSREIHLQHGVSISYNTLGNYEAGRTVPTLDNFLIMAATLQESPAYLLPVKHTTPE